MRRTNETGAKYVQWKGTHNRNMKARLNEIREARLPTCFIYTTPPAGGHKYDRFARVDLMTHIAGKVDHILWVRTHGKLIPRELRKIFGDGPKETQRDGDRLMTIIAEHKVVARAWL